MEPLNHALALAEQTHAELTLLAAGRHDALQGSPADVAKRLAGNVLSLTANLKVVRHKVTTAARDAARAAKTLAGCDSPPSDGPAVFSVVTCEMVSAPPHVAPPPNRKYEQTIDKMREQEEQNGGDAYLGPTTFQPKRESDRPKQQSAGANPNSMFG